MRLQPSYQSPGRLTNLADDEDYNRRAKRVNATWREAESLTYYIQAGSVGGPKYILQSGKLLWLRIVTGMNPCSDLQGRRPACLSCLSLSEYGTGNFGGFFFILRDRRRFARRG